jgi:hypothetical protein
MPPQEITRYVDLEMRGNWGVITLYNDPEGKDETNGTIDVGPEGAVITFAQLPNRDAKWSFWNLTIHPLGKKVGAADLDWCVRAKEAVLRDTTAAERQRDYSYTLALETEDGTKYYLDPKLVNTGGGGGG